MSEEYIPHTDLIGEELSPLVTEIKEITGNEERLKEMLVQANSESSSYAQKYILKPTSKDKKNKRNSKSTSTAE
jgi:CRISPR-associated protein Csc2